MRKKFEAERQAAAEKAKAEGEKAKADGEAFLAANKAKPGVITLESGLQYEILKAGDGKKPTQEDTVLCNYRGTRVDGTEFDSSYGRGEPASFPVKGVIKGWTEALQLMPVGSKWRLVIPAQLAYGPLGKGPIAPNSTLVFELELLGVK
jgi:FKBP-type peptidyl-prolyl cis-trans isomerase FklB